jgi:hypothetical protein
MMFRANVLLTGAAAALTSMTVLAQVSERPADSSPPAQTADTTKADDEIFAFDGDTALWTVAIKPEKTADFERVMMSLRDGLAASADPVRQRQAEGWKLVRLSTPLPDGGIAYVHIIRPVVADADYSVMRALYEAFPMERRELYEMYRGAFVRNVALAVGTLALDLSRSGAAAVVPSDEMSTK